MRARRLICSGRIKSTSHASDKAKLFIVWVPLHLSGLRTLNNINVRAGASCVRIPASALQGDNDAPNQ